MIFDIANHTSPFKAYFLTKIRAVEDYPFGPDVAVFKVCDKMFGTFSILSGTEFAACEKPYRGIEAINLKCDPDQACALRDIFPAVRPGYHMNKKHWNTVILDGTIPASEVERMIDHSYDLVVSRLPKSLRLFKNTTE